MTPCCRKMTLFCIAGCATITIERMCEFHFSASLFGLAMDIGILGSSPDEGEIFKENGYENHH